VDTDIFLYLTIQIIKTATMNFKILIFSTLPFFVLTNCENETPKSEPLSNSIAVNHEDKLPLPKPVPIRKVEYPLAFSLDYLMGKFNPAKDTAFTKISTKHADRDELYMRKDAYTAFQKMHNAAKQEGITLTIRSAARNFANQKRIWESKWSGRRKLSGNVNAAKKFPKAVPRALKILEFSSMPSTSRHHWGTDIDLNNFNNEYFTKGRGLKEYKWLTAHAVEYGYCQVYTEKSVSGREGYNEEKWHWSYLPISKQLTELAQREMKDELIKGFKGSETAKEIGVVEKYILGISQDCF
jgi:D-alanyl-D-alanine carboxypeptidase